jgi:hypothetical protein
LTRKLSVSLGVFRMPTLHNFLGATVAYFFLQISLHPTTLVYPSNFIYVCTFKFLSNSICEIRLHPFAVQFFFTSVSSFVNKINPVECFLPNPTTGLIFAVVRLLIQIHHRQVLLSLVGRSYRFGLFKRI